ncbi:MAG: DUF1868 domain-containing protein [Elusimicrobiota bacterium]
MVDFKFDKAGSFRPFPGTSMVSMLRPEMSQYGLIAELQRGLKALPSARSFAFLPPSSFHMTVKDLLCDQVRESEHWTSKIPRDASLAAADARLAELTRGIAFGGALRMRFAGIHPLGLSIKLEPADAETREALRDYRERISDATGIRHPNHDAYEFHISLAYLLYELNDAEKDALGRFLAEAGKDLERRFGVLELPPPELAFFPDMSRFPKRRPPAP